MELSDFWRPNQQLDLLSQVFDGVADKRIMRASRAVVGDNT